VIYYYPIVDWDTPQYEYNYSINVYDAENVYHFVSDPAFGSMLPSGEPEAHYFHEVPFSIFYLTDDAESIFKCVIGLQDAYNKMLSDSVNDWESFVDAYMVLTNMTATKEDIAEMKQNRVIVLDDDATVSYLTKSSSDTIVQNLLDDINVAIHTISNSPDFSSEEFGSGVSSGIALQFKLVGFNNIAGNIENQFRKAIMRRIHLLNTIFTLIDWEAYDIHIEFNHNLPSSIADTVDSVNKLRGLVSDETLLGMLPFVPDAKEELARIEAQNDRLSGLYDFGGSADGTVRSEQE
jgi:SPP1 family phage portal protein